MKPDATRPTSYPSAPDWTGSDFVITILGGFAGAFVGAALTFDSEPLELLLVSLLLQNLGHLAALWYVIKRRGSSFPAIGLDVQPNDGVFIFLGVALQIGLSLLVIPIAQRLGFEGSTQEITDSIPSDASSAFSTSGPA